jgi:[protein-PII] uridylyltransferase
MVPEADSRRVNHLIAKIEENARRRLVLPPLSKPSDELPRYRQFLKVESHRLRILHRGGAGGLEVCQARAGMMDVLIRHVWEAVQRAFPARGLAPAITLVAFGGYGRGELNPWSDIDLMFLHAGGPDLAAERQKVLADWTSGLLYTLWDIGLKVGHAVRTVEDCIEVANGDMQSKTSLLEARRVAGDERLFEIFQSRFTSGCVKGHSEEYIRQRLEDQRARRQKNGNSPALQEPNIKNGVGGLRDFQNLLWMSFFQEGSRTLADLQSRDLLGSAERKQLESAYDFLLRTRTELHHVAGRAVDMLAANVKPAVALGLGYSDRSPRARVEEFMRDYYTHARNIYLITRTLEQRMALGRGRAGGNSTPPAPGSQFDGFRVVDGQLRHVYKTALRDDPRRFLRAFLHCQQRGLSLHPDLAQLMRQQLAVLDRSFLADRHNHVTFLEILNQRGNVSPHLRAMHEVGFLGKFIPEFGKLTNLVQHEFYHQYAVDEHTLTCIEKLDQVWNATEKPRRNYTEVFRSLERPFVLYLALLLHDAGKAAGTGHHEIVGGELAMKVSRRLKLDAGTTDSLRRIIELHLLMVQVSQRRDLEDPGVIADFSRAVGSAENLMLLALHTYADSMGTSDTLWNGFKDSLLWSLYHKSMALMRGGPEFIEAQRAVLERLREEVRGMLPKTFAPDELDGHFLGLPPRYFQLHSARDIVRDLTLAHRFMHLQLTEAERSLEPVVAWQEDRDRGYAAVHICTWDRAGLFTKVAGALTAAGLNIFGAQVFTRADGIVLDTFYVAEARTGALPAEELRDRFEKILLRVLTGIFDLDRAIAQAPRYPSMFRAGGERMPIKIRVDAAASPTAIVIDIEAEDRVGFLYAVSKTLYDLGLSIALARISTENGAALDTFYVTDVEGQKITDAEWLARIEPELRRAIGG